MPNTIKERLYNKIVRESDNGCWLFAGYRDPAGYGRLIVNNESKFTHRISWELHCGPIPDGLSVLHKCDVRCCINPDHLFIGTQADNVNDAITKRRHFSQLPGERNCNSKLSDAQVIEIRERMRNGERPVDLAHEFKVSSDIMYQIKSYRSRKHLP